MKNSFVEINLKNLNHNLAILKNDMPKNLGFALILKDNAYGHGAVEVAKVAEMFKPNFFAVADLEEAIDLKKKELNTPILIFGERSLDEILFCIENNLIFFLNDIGKAVKANNIAKKLNKIAQVHIEVDTGLSRYGIHHEHCSTYFKQLSFLNYIHIQGLMSHFAQSDAHNKTFAHQQIKTFNDCIKQLDPLQKQEMYLHACNSGGYLDLPYAHYNLVRIGTLIFGLHPSQTCRHLNHLKPVMSLQSKISHIKYLRTGESVGYGMHYTAKKNETLAIIPMGYGQGYPRLRNQGYVLVHGQKAPIVGGNSMDATMINISSINNVQLWDLVTLIGQQKNEYISMHQVAQWDSTVSYNLMTRIGNLSKHKVYT